MTEEDEMETKYRKEWLRKLWMLENKEVPKEQREDKEKLVFHMRKIAGSWVNPFGKIQDIYDDFSRVWHPELDFEEAFDIVRLLSWSEGEDMTKANVLHREDDGLQTYRAYPATTNALLTEIFNEGKPPWWETELKMLGVQ